MLRPTFPPARALGPMLSAALLTVAACATRPARAQPAAEPPASPSSAPEQADGPTMLRYPPSSTRGWVLGAGIGLWAVSYGIGMAAGFGWDDVPGADALKVPLVGPWVALGQSGCAPDQDDCTGELVLRTILTTLGGLAQLGGAGLVLEGLLMTTEAEAPADERPRGETAPVRAELWPIVAPTQAGVAVHVAF